MSFFFVLSKKKISEQENVRRNGLVLNKFHYSKVRFDNPNFAEPRRCLVLSMEIIENVFFAASVNNL